jgi:hypothetical protein
MCPSGKDVYFGLPNKDTPKYDYIHISVTFTWDLNKVDLFKSAWKKYGKVKVGGPALGDVGNIFMPGFYLKEGVTITSRGCPNNCPWCFVPKREGGIKELLVMPGHIIQDNNLLACSEKHLQKVFEMLQTQRQIDFSGGLDARLITKDIVQELSRLKIKQIWIAYDHCANKRAVEKAVNLLRQYFKRDKIRCYVLIGFGNDTIEKAEQRLKWAWDVGTLPFAMLYHPFKEWKQFQRLWTRPAIIKARMGE